MKKILVAIAVSLALTSCKEQPYTHEDWQREQDKRCASCITKFNYEGHSYLLYQYGHGIGICHDENCECKKGGQKLIDIYITEEQAMQMTVLGLNINKWTGRKYFKPIPETKHEEWCEEELIMKEVTDYIMLPKMRIDEAAKYLREELGIDIVISPKFNSKTGDRIGYFWRWSQRTDVNIQPKTHRSYESALCDALKEILNQITPDYGKRD